VATALGVIAAVLLFYLVNPWFNPEAGTTLNQIVTAGFWISFIALLVVLFQMRKEPGGETVEIEGPAFTRFLFSNSRRACSGCRSGCSSASNGSRPAGTSSTILRGSAPTPAPRFSGSGRTP
jgi:hypothetical protein